MAPGLHNKADMTDSQRDKNQNINGPNKKKRELNRKSSEAVGAGPA